MNKTDKDNDSQQIDLFDYFSMLENALNGQPSDKLTNAVSKLKTAVKKASWQEKVEKVKQEQEKKQQKEKEEQQNQQEHIQQVTSMELPLDWSNLFDTDERTRGVHAESISDGLILSLSNMGQVDIEYISSITGEDYKTVISALKGSIFQNPDKWEECFYKGWETSEEYLSGNLMEKLHRAFDANKKYMGYFSDNIRAIERILPPQVASRDIYITLGSPWIPSDVIDDFILHLFGNPYKNYGKQYQKQMLQACQTIHDEITGAWEIPNKSRYDHSVGVSKSYGTKRIEALHILERTLNMKAIVVTDEVPCRTNKSGKKNVINKEETLAANEKQKKLIDAFKSWVWKDADRKERLTKIYGERYGCIRRRIYDGSFLQFPGMSPDVNLYPYQKNAAARIIFTPNTLLAHDVGAGKTYIMIAAGQELRRMGLSKKNLYVVPNNLVGQWRDIFMTMYPNANILCIDPKSFVPAKREAVLKKMRDEEYDGIIIAYSSFELIPLSKQFYINQLEEKQKKLLDYIRSRERVTKSLERQERELAKAIYELTYTIEKKCCPVYFDEMGFTRIFVDEAHNFKNVPLKTKASGTLGINSNGSRRCEDMINKVHLVQKANGGGGAVLATGTPITNSITDIYVMQQYLQSGELAMLDLGSFDSWVGMFAEKKTEFEIDVDTNSYRLATRFSKFHNLPELTSLLSSFADFHQIDQSAEIPIIDGYNDTVIPRSEGLKIYLQDISKRADIVRQGGADPTKDNMLKITTDGRKAALDMRLTDSKLSFDPQCKVERCAENAAHIYFATENQNSTQLIFCDTSTPKENFNIYDELKKRLIFLGIPDNKIEYIHNAKTEKQRDKLFERVRKGEIRILIGSTFKLGLGVNVQDKLIAVHHLDVPWRPADMTQREGRILRQGNENKKVYIYRYITEGSFDAYSWQLLETKQKFINQILSGSLTQRSGSDIDDTALSYGEVKALAVGNPIVKERVEIANELARYLTLQRKLTESKAALEKELMEIPAKEANQRKIISKCKQDTEFYLKQKQLEETAETDISKKEEAYNRRLIREFIADAVSKNLLKEKETKLMSYKGFDIILPANMIAEKPFVWLIRTGKYYVELGDKEVGNLLRIENFLNALPQYLEKQKAKLKELGQKKSDIKAELEKGEDYSDLIEDCIKKLDRLDKKLGVNQNE